MSTIRGIPSYIAQSGITDLPITPEAGGDYSKITNTCSTSKKFYALMDGFSCRASWALASAMAEWTLWRYGNYEEYPAAFLFTEASWAGLIDYRYLQRWKVGLAKLPYKKRDFQEQHPGVAAKFKSNYILSLTYRDLEGHLPSVNWINYQANLVRNVLPSNKKRLFTAWLKKVCPRLKELYPLIDWDNDLDGEEFLAMLPTWNGPPVPREALDPNIDYTHDMADDCLARFLEGLDHKNNPFLHSPKHMIDAGFEGTPYTWPAK